MTTPDPLDALVAEALAELDSLCLFVGLAPGDPAYRDPIMRAFEALVADRAQQAERVAALEMALDITLWRPYLGDSKRLVCRECGMSKGCDHDPMCEFIGLDALAATRPTP